MITGAEVGRAEVAGSDGSKTWRYVGANAVTCSVAPAVALASAVVFDRAICACNKLNWFRHDARTDGGFRWASGSGGVVGTGWDFTTLFGAGDGVIYGITPLVPAHLSGRTFVPTSGGDLKWYRHDGQNDDTFTWAARSGSVVGTGWNTFQKVFSGGNGIIYAITPVVAEHFDNLGRFVPASGGDLTWYRHTGAGDGTFAWAPGSGTVVGRGWGTFKQVFSGGDGVIYSINSSDQLFYRHDGAATGVRVGTGLGCNRRRGMDVQAVGRRRLT